MNINNSIEDIYNNRPTQIDRYSGFAQVVFRLGKHGIVKEASLVRKKKSKLTVKQRQFVLYVHNQFLTLEAKNK